MAFAGPSSVKTDADGFPAFTPEDCVPIFREAGIRLVIRLNRKDYDQHEFTDRGIRHVELYFADGSCPPASIVSRFLAITECEPGPVAVHCKAGLGRTCSLIALYAMKHFQFPARAFIGWCRIARPGSVLGPQQQYLVDMEETMLRADQTTPASAQGVPPHRVISSANVNVAASPERHREDVGQGERLRGARRSAGGTSSKTASPDGSRAMPEPPPRSPQPPPLPFAAHNQAMAPEVPRRQPDIRCQAWAAEPFLGSRLRQPQFASPAVGAS